MNDATMKTKLEKIIQRTHKEMAKKRYEKYERELLREGQFCQCSSCGKKIEKADKKTLDWYTSNVNVCGECYSRLLNIHEGTCEVKCVVCGKYVMLKDTVRIWSGNYRACKQCGTRINNRGTK